MLRTSISRIITTHNVCRRTLTSQSIALVKDNKQQEEEKKRSWQPTKRVSRVTMEKIRSLAALHPDHYNSVSLAAEFRISPEAVKRILKSKFRPESTVAERQEKNRYAAMGERKQRIQAGTVDFSAPFSATSSKKKKNRGWSSLTKE